MSFTGNEDHKITFSKGAEITKNYRLQMPTNSILGGYMSKAAIESLFTQEGIVGIRIYYGIDEGKQTFVICGVDSAEGDQIGDDYSCLDSTIPCPNFCTVSILNS